MKCSNCNHTWNLFDTDEENFDFCPQCEKKFIAKYQNFDSVSEGLAYCLRVGGKEMLRNKAKMNSYISDLMGNSFPDRNLIKNAVDSGIGSVLLDADNKSQQEKQAAAAQAAGQLVREFSTAQKKAEEVVFYFTEALQWENVLTPAGNPVSENSQNADVENSCGNVSIANDNKSDAQNMNAAIQQDLQGTGNASLQGDYPAVNAELADDNQTGTEVVQGNAAVVKKKSPVKWIILLIILLLLAIGILVLMYMNKQEETPVLVAEVSDTETEAELLTEAPTESETEAETETETEPATAVPTEPETEPETSAAEVNELTVTNLCTIADYDDFKHSYLCYDPVNQRIYFHDGRNKISYYDMQNQTTNVALDTTEQNILLHDFAVNPYNGKLYVMLEDGIYDAEADKLIYDNISYGYEYGFTFLSENELVYGSVKISLDTGEKLVSGKYPLYDNRDMNYYVPFKHDGEYYYFVYSYSFDSYVFKVPDILTSDGSYSDGFKFEDNDNKIKTFCTDLNELYYMTQDNSIYQYDFNKSTEDSGFLNKNDSDILIIDGNEIQNAKSGYVSTEIVDLIKVDDSFVLFDEHDKSIKMISNFSAPQE